MGRRRTRRSTDELRRAVGCLPAETRAAMLAGLREERIVAGAYSHRGGVCPMLAAHRRGGRTSVLSFAKAWDRFTGAARPRRATEREIRVLAAHLAASLAADADLGSAIADHRAMVADTSGSLARLEAGAQIVSPGRLKTISGIRQPGEVFSR
jgi:hypothetical protein